METKPKKMILKISVFGRVRDLKVTLKNHPDISKINLFNNILRYFPPDGKRPLMYLIEAPEIGKRLMFQAEKINQGFKVLELNRSPVLTLDMG